MSVVDLNRLRRVGVEPAPLLCAGCILPSSTRRIRQHLPPRNQSYVRSVAVHGHLTTRFLQRIGRKGGENSRKYLPKRLVKQLAQKAANARWRKGDMRQRSVKY